MKKFVLIIILLLLLIVIIIFRPGLKTIDRLVTTKEEVNLWKKDAIEGNMTATSNLIIFYENKIEQNKWLNLYKEQRATRRNEYLDLKKKSEEGNITATLKIRELREVGYF